MPNDSAALLKSLLLMKDGLIDNIAKHSEETHRLTSELNALKAKIDSGVEELYALHFDQDPGVIVLGDVAVVGMWVDDNTDHSNFR